ncbi:MAG: flippase-like domain-containing protein [Deltaproteobacteria bacterium]|nr:flippase-like domain-containing protein [Deltaproteobacteria bacterium]
MDTTLKKRLLYILQISIGLALVVWILMQVDQEQFFAYFSNIHEYKVMFILVLSVLSLVIQFRRWRYLIEKYSNHYDLRDLLPSFFAGFTFRIIIPGGPAEFSKIFMLPGKKRGKILAFGMEKVFLTLIKLMAILIVLPLSFPKYSIYCFALFVVLVIAYIFIPRLPYLKDWQEKDVNYHVVFVNNVIFSLGIFVVMGLQYYILINQVDVISLAATFHTSVYLWCAGMVPISISGLGVREGLAVYFFRLYGVSPANAVATSLFLFVINTIFPALIGTYFIYKKRSHFREIKGSIKSTREIIASVRRNRKSEDNSAEN